MPQHLLKTLAINLEDKPNINAENRKKLEEYLDAGYGSCSLQRQDIAKLVENTFFYFDGQRYQLLEWVIMPNHVHVIIEMFEMWPLERILHSWCSYTSNEANKILERTGRYWATDYFDRYIRDEKHYNNAVDYYHNNPVKAGLVDLPEEWLYSSAAWKAGRRKMD